MIEIRQSLSIGGKTYQGNKNNLVLIDDREVEHSLVHCLNEIDIKLQVAILQLIVKLQESTS